MQLDPKEKEAEETSENQEQEEQPERERETDWIDDLVISTVNQQNKEFGPQL